MTERWINISDELPTLDAYIKVRLKNLTYKVGTITSTGIFIEHRKNNTIDLSEIKEWCYV